MLIFAMSASALADFFIYPELMISMTMMPLSAATPLMARIQNVVHTALGRTALMVAGVGLLAAATLSAPATAAAQETAGDGKTRIATWRDDKKGAFMLMFDDCCTTHVTNVYPTLKKAGIPGTFYVVVEKGERKAKAQFWDEVAPKEPVM